MKQKNQSYGWMYAKDGSLKTVLPPANVKGKIMKKHTTVSCGHLHDSVGFGRIANHNETIDLSRR